MVVWVAPVVGRQVWRKERSCPRWDVSTQMRAKWTSTTSRALARPGPTLRSPPVFGGRRVRPELSLKEHCLKWLKLRRERVLWSVVERPTVRYKRKSVLPFVCFII